MFIGPLITKQNHIDREWVLLVGGGCYNQGAGCHWLCVIDEVLLLVEFHVIGCVLGVH